MEGCLLYKRNSFLLTVAVVVFLAMTLSGTNANPEEDETAAGGGNIYATAERYARASPLRWGKRAPLRWGKRDSASDLQQDQAAVELMDNRQLREAPLRWGKRASPLRWGKRSSSPILGAVHIPAAEGIDLKRAPLRWGKRAAPMRFGKRTTDDDLADYYEAETY